MILLTEAGLGVLALVLLVNALLPDPLLWPLYVVAAGVSALSGLQRPALDSLMARIVPHEQLTAAAALNGLRYQFGAIAGPALAGVVVAFAGHAAAYSVTVLGFLASVLLCLRLSPAPPVKGPNARRCAGSPRARATRGAGPSCWGRTPSTWRRCSSPSRTRSIPSSRTSSTRSGRWG